MDDFLTSSTFIFICFLVVGSAIVYLILLFDKKQRQKLNTILGQTKDVQPLFMQRAAQQKLNSIKQICENDTREGRLRVAQQLDELMADYDKGNISLPDYCHRLNILREQVA